MKAFQGTLLAFLALLALLGAWFYLRPPEQPVAAKKDDKKEQGVELFAFEKADLVKVEVKRPDGTIILTERDDGWWIEGENLRASRSMVNRVKHQIHDLTARATVVENPEAGNLYGFGAAGIHVTLHFRDGSTREFEAGDPNPSGVSFYIRPLPGDTIYTVKKSAVDYYSLTLAEFRERRFASFDSKDVDQLEADLPEGRRLKFQRTGDHAWDMLEPRTFAADDSEIRALLGRVSAMKAIEFITDTETELSKYGLDQPRARIIIRFSNRDPLTLLVGALTGAKDGEYPLTYVKLAEEASIYAARDGLLEDYLADPEDFRLKRFARIDVNDLSEMVVTFQSPDQDADLNKTITVRNAADNWQWEDGVIVPGSTPRRLATRATSVESEEFVAEASADAAYGFDQPLARIVMKDNAGNTRTLLVGKKAEPGKRPEGEPYDRYYARVVEFPEVYIVEGGIVDIVKDMMREHRRKADSDAEKAERRERIEGGQ